MNSHLQVYNSKQVWRNKKHGHTTLLRLNQCMARIVCTCTVSGYTSALRPILQFLITDIIIKWYDLDFRCLHSFVCMIFIFWWNIKSFRLWKLDIHTIKCVVASEPRANVADMPVCSCWEFPILTKKNHIVFGVTIGTYWVFYRMVMVWNYVDYLPGDFDYIILSVLHDSWQNKLHRK